MITDRLLITCSIIELSVVACYEGLDCFTRFQLATILLLAMKAMAVLVEYHRAAARPVPIVSDEPAFREADPSDSAN